VVLNLIGRDPFLHGMSRCTYITCQPPSNLLLFVSLGRLFFIVFLRDLHKGKVNLEAHRAQVLSYFGPRAGAWFIIRLIFSSFQLIFLNLFHNTLNLT